MAVLDPDLVEVIAERAIKNGLSDPNARSVFMRGLPAQFVDSIPRKDRPVDQLHEDLKLLNAAEALVGHPTAPLARWLQNVARARSALPIAVWFEQLAQAILDGAPLPATPPPPAPAVVAPPPAPLDQWEDHQLDVLARKISTTMQARRRGAKGATVTVQLGSTALTVQLNAELLSDSRVADAFDGLVRSVDDLTEAVRHFENLAAGPAGNTAYYGSIIRERKALLAERRATLHRQMEVLVVAIEPA